MHVINAGADAGGFAAVGRKAASKHFVDIGLVVNAIAGYIVGIIAFTCVRLRCANLTYAGLL